MWLPSFMELILVDRCDYCFILCWVYLYVRNHKRGPSFQFSGSSRLIKSQASQIAKFMGPTWGPPGSCRPQMGPMLAPWTLLSGVVSRYCHHPPTVAAFWIPADPGSVTIQEDPSEIHLKLTSHKISLFTTSFCSANPLTFSHRARLGNSRVLYKIPFGFVK